MVTSKKAFFRFYEELNDFLPKNRRKIALVYSFNNRPRVVDVIEQYGVPRSQVDLILLNGKSVGFNQRLQDDDRVSVYPTFEAIDISPINVLRPKPLRITRFILDLHLGRLTKYLRMCGFDCYYENLSDDEIIQVSRKDLRIILTKDRGLLKNKWVTHGYWIRADEPKQQLIEVIKRFDLVDKVKLLVRCLICNNLLQEIDRSMVPEQILQQTALSQIYYSCAHCNKIYWKGSHYQNMVRMLQQIITTVQVYQDFDGLAE